MAEQQTMSEGGAHTPLIEYDQEEAKVVGFGCGVCFSCIESGSVGVVQKCGAFEGYQEPGCICFCPPITQITSVSLAVQQLICRSDCKTKDNVTVSVATSVSYRIEKAKVQAALFGIVDPERQIKAHVDNVLRSTLPTMDLDECFSAKDHMVKNILDEVKDVMRPFGYEIINVLMTDLKPEQSVLHAMNEINTSRRLKEAAIARGDADKVLKIKASEADAEAMYLNGVGISKMRKAIADGFKESFGSMKESGIDVEDAMHLMVTTQYLDTLKEFAVGKSSIMVPHGVGAKDMESQIRDGGIIGAALKTD